jgi:cytochrome c oxidase cbb3-type subunit II
VPESVMPKYGYLADRVIDGRYVEGIMSTHAFVGVPYTEEMLAHARADFMAQADPDNADTSGLEERYAKINLRNFDGQPEVTEMDALIAYLQMLGTLVDFSTYAPVASR